MAHRLVTVLTLVLAGIGCSSDDPKPTESGTVSPGPKSVPTEQPSKPAPKPKVTHVLRHQFKKGETRHLLTTHNIKQVAGGMESPMMVKQYSKWTTEEVLEDGSGRLSHSVPRVAFRMTSPLGILKYDSTDDEEPDSPLWAQLKPEMDYRLKTSYSCVISPTGKVSDLKISDEFREALKKNLATASTDPVEYLSADTSDYFIEYPEDPTAPGDTWPSVEMNYSMLGGRITKTGEYKLESEDSSSQRSTLRISMTHNVKADFPEDATFLMNFLPDATDQIVVELPSGRLVSRVVKSANEMILKMMGVETVIQRKRETTIVPYVDSTEDSESGSQADPAQQPVPPKTP
jgi:hypothetical protein